LQRFELQLGAVGLRHVLKKFDQLDCLFGKFVIAALVDELVDKFSFFSTAGKRFVFLQML